MEVFASMPNGSDNIHQFRKKNTKPTPMNVRIFVHVIFSSFTPDVPRQDSPSNRCEQFGINDTAEQPCRAVEVHQDFINYPNIYSP